VGTKWQEAWLFSRSEQRGIVVLVVICLASVLYAVFVPAWISRREIADFERTFEVLAASRRDVRQITADTIPPKEPETIAEDGQRGSTYGNRQPLHRPVLQKAAIVTDSTLRINTAGARDMIRTGLVPREIAYRLVKFRDQLGGFHSVEQLRDIYGMTDSLFTVMEDHVEVENTELSVIYVNSLSAEELMGHPYISKGLAAQMVNFREKVKPFATREDLAMLYFMDEALLEKIMPYISFY
jgi:DNA uptake protein ComE-like DNA-binding protein